MPPVDNWFTRPLGAHRCVYLCDWLPPDFGAVGQYSLQFARERAERGEDVLLVGFSSTASSVDVETIRKGRLTIWRWRARSYDKSRFLSRAWWTLSINVLLMIKLLPHLMRTNEVVFTGSPPFMVHWIAPLNMLLRKTAVYRITDFYPECIMAARGRAGFVLQTLHRLTIFWRKRITVLEVIGEDQRTRLLETGIPAARIRLKRDPSPVSITAEARPLPAPAGLAGRVILLYSGNFGVAHDHETFTTAYIRHHTEGSGRVALWLNAVGSGADIVEQTLRAANVPVVRTRPVPLEQLPSLLITPQAHLITLRDEFVGYVMPSKVYGCIESGKAVLYIGSDRSDVHLLCSEKLPSDQFHHVPVGDVERLFEVLERIGQSPSECETGSRASLLAD